MKCFPFYTGEKKEELNPVKSNSALSSSSTLSDREFRYSRLELGSQNASDTSIESRGRSQFPSLSDTSSNLRVFTFSELKAATKNFNRTTKIGEGGFGCVFKATVKSGEDSVKKIDVAVKQLGRTGLQVVGIMIYAAPEYVQTGRLTSKSDVWSYGVFLYELITGRHPLDRNRPRSEQKLLEWVKPCISDSKKFQQILDPRLESKISRSAQKLSIVANRCLVRHPKSRPKMSEVLEMVNKVVEESTGIGNPAPPVRIVESTPPESERKGKRRLIDIKDGGRLVRMWSTKLINTC